MHGSIITRAPAKAHRGHDITCRIGWVLRATSGAKNCLSQTRRGEVRMLFGDPSSKRNRLEMRLKKSPLSLVGPRNSLSRGRPFPALSPKRHVLSASRRR